MPFAMGGSSQSRRGRIDSPAEELLRAAGGGRLQRRPPATDHSRSNPAPRPGRSRSAGRARSEFCAVCRTRRLFGSAAASDRAASRIHSSRSPRGRSPTLGVALARPGGRGGRDRCHHGRLEQRVLQRNALIERHRRRLGERDGSELRIAELESQLARDLAEAERATRDRPGLTGTLNRSAGWILPDAESTLRFLTDNAWRQMAIDCSCGSLHVRHRDGSWHAPGAARPDATFSNRTESEPRGGAPWPESGSSLAVASGRAAARAPRGSPSDRGGARKSPLTVSKCWCLPTMRRRSTCCEGIRRRLPNSPRRIRSPPSPICPRRFPRVSLAPPPLRRRIPPAPMRVSPNRRRPIFLNFRHKNRSSPFRIAGRAARPGTARSSAFGRSRCIVIRWSGPGLLSRRRATSSKLRSLPA